MSYDLVPLETVSDPPSSGDIKELVLWLVVVKLALDELNSKIHFVADEAGVVIPASG